MRRALLALAACVLATPAALAAQGWSAEAAVGRAAYDQLASRVSTTSGSLGVRYNDSRRWLYASAGTPLDGQGSGWGATGAGGYLAVGRGRGFSVGANLAGHAFGYTAADTGSVAGAGGTVELLPTVMVRRGPVRAQLSSGFVGVADGFEGMRPERRGFLDSSAGLAWTPSTGVELSAGARFLRGTRESLPYAGAGGQLDRGWGGAWVYAGAWLDAVHPSPAAAAGVGASLKLGARTELAGAFRQEPRDPLYRSTPRRSWSVTLRRGFGRRAVPAPGRPLAPPPLVMGENVTFRLPRAPGDTLPPSVLGDFSRWLPVTMAPHGEFWTATIRIPRGVHHYGFRAPDGTVLVPEGLPRVEDGLGGFSAVLVVE